MLKSYLFDTINYQVAKFYFKKIKKIISKALADRISRDLSSLSPHINLYVTKEAIEPYKLGMRSNQAKKNLEVVLSVLNEVLILTIAKGVPLIRKNIIDYDLYFILEGSVGIYMDNSLIAKLNQEEIFGEMALLDEKHRRYTDAISLTDIKLILIPRNILRGLERRNPKLAIKLLHLLCSSLSNKVSSANEYLALKK